MELELNILTKIYGEKKAVDDLSLHICPGEIYEFMTGIQFLKIATANRGGEKTQFKEKSIVVRSASQALLIWLLMI